MYLEKVIHKTEYYIGVDVLVEGIYTRVVLASGDVMWFTPLGTRLDSLYEEMLENKFVDNENGNRCS